MSQERKKPRKSSSGASTTASSGADDAAAAPAPEPGLDDKGDPTDPLHGVLSAEFQTTPPEGDGKCRITLGKWGGHDNYTCERCSFASLDEQVAVAQREACERNGRAAEDAKAAEAAGS